MGLPGCGHTRPQRRELGTAGLYPHGDTQFQGSSAGPELQENLCVPAPLTSLWLWASRTFSFCSHCAALQGLVSVHAAPLCVCQSTAAAGAHPPRTTPHCTRHPLASDPWQHAWGMLLSAREGRGGQVGTDSGVSRLCCPSCGTEWKGQLGHGLWCWGESRQRSPPSWALAPSHQRGTGIQPAGQPARLCRAFWVPLRELREILPMSAHQS